MTEKEPSSYVQKFHYTPDFHDGSAALDNRSLATKNFPLLRMSHLLSSVSFKVSKLNEHVAQLYLERREANQKAFKGKDLVLEWPSLFVY